MSKIRRTKLKAEPLIETSSVPTETYPGVGYEPDQSVHAPKVPDQKKPAPKNPDQGFLREVEEEPVSDDMVLTEPMRYIVDPKDAIERMEALTNKVEESRPDLAQRVEVVRDAIDQLERAADGQDVAPLAEAQPETPAFNEGDRVTVTLEDGTYEGMVEKANDDGTFAVRTDQAMTLQNVPPTSMQKAEVQSMTLPASLRMRLKAARMVTDAIAEAFKAGKKRRIANTSTDGQTVWLHNNPIVRKAADGSVEVSLAGWPTATTRERINGILSALGLDGRVSQRGGAQMLNGKPWDGEWTSVGPAVDMGDAPGTAPAEPGMPPVEAGKKVKAAKINQKALLDFVRDHVLEFGTIPGEFEDTDGTVYTQNEFEGLISQPEWDSLMKKVRASKKVKAAKPKKVEEPAEKMETCNDCGTELDPEKGEVFLTDDGSTYCADCFANHEGEGEDDENREPDPEMDVVIGKDDLSAYYAGKQIASVTRDEADEDSDALYKAIAAWMDTKNYWPDVWWISDHGNSNIITEDVFKFTKGAGGDEEAIKAMLGLNAAKAGDRVSVGDRQARVLRDPDKDGVVEVRYLNDGSEEKVHVKNLAVLGPDTKVERKPSHKDAPGNPDGPVMGVKADGEAAPAEAGAKKWYVVERKWSDGNDASSDGDLIVEAASPAQALDLVIAKVSGDFKSDPDEQDGDDTTYTFSWFQGDEADNDESGWVESYTLFVEGPYASEAEARENTSKMHGTPSTLEASAALGTGEGRVALVAGKSMGHKASPALIAKLKAAKVKAAEATNTAQSGTETGKVKSGYEPTGVMVVEEGGKPRAFDQAKDDVVPAELFKNAEGKFALVNPNGENSYEEGANDELELSYWATVKSLAPADAQKPAETPAAEPAKTAEAPAQTKEAVAASAKATALAARAKLKAAKEAKAAEVKASAFDEIAEIELGGGFKAKRKAAKKGEDGGEDTAAEIEVVDADGKVKATYPDAFGDDTVTIIKFLRQVLDIKDTDDKAAAKKEEKGEKKGEGGESDIAEKPRALPATKDEEPKKETEKEAEQLAAKKMEARMEGIRMIATRLLRSGHIQANLDDVDDGLVKGLTLAGAQEAAAKKAVDRKVLDLLAQPEDELLLIKASLPLLEDRRVTVQASDGGLGPINLSAAGVIDVSTQQSNVGLGAAFGRGFRR